MRWFRALLPREERFFDLYNAHAAILVRAAEALQAMLGGGEAIAERSRKIALEHDADVVTRDMLRAVRRTFITPFDRRDIVDLISSMDDAIDQMQQTAKAILLYDVRTFEPEMRKLADAIQCARRPDFDFGDLRWRQQRARAHWGPRRDAGGAQARRDELEAVLQELGDELGTPFAA